jgi:2-oxoisovalerate dehydrogenase E1 component
MKFNRKGLDDNQLKEFYSALLKPRLIEKKMLIALRQGRISKWFSGYGQEAISVGATLAMEEDEFMLPMHRNLGMFTTRKVPLERLFSQFQGKAKGFTKGRDRSFHFGSIEHHLVGMISHLGPQLGIADGIALAHKLKKESKVALVITGDGGASEGDFHEALNVAAVWKLPVIFLIENNQWGLSTPSEEQFAFKSFVYKAIGYGVKGKSVDGNNLLDVYHAVREIAQEIKEEPVPFILECHTFRMRGHEEASGTKYYPDGLQEQWAEKDPVENFRAFLINEGILSPEENERISTALKTEINQAFEDAFKEEPIKFDLETELSDRFAPPSYQIIEANEEAKHEMRMVDAFHDALRMAMERHPQLVLMGQDIGHYGGVFKVTEGLAEQFGVERVRNTPLCESAIVGASLGLSIAGFKAVMEMQFADFVTEGFNQIINNLAKIHYRWGQKADVVIRMPTGAGVGAGPFHSQSNEAWFTHVPGLKVVYPAFPQDAKGLLLSAIDDPNPVLVFEHKALYRSIRGEVSENYFHVPIGKANCVHAGEKATVITYGAGVHWVLDNLDETQASVEVIDLRSLMPLDEEAIINSVKKTGRALILTEDTLFGSIASDIAAIISENCFEYLDAPVKRVASLDTPVPFAAALEAGFLPKERFKEALESLLAY